MKRIVAIARTERARSGIKSVEKVTHYNMKWHDAIKSAAKKVLAERNVRQTRMRFPKW